MQYLNAVAHGVALQGRLGSAPREVRVTGDADVVQGAERQVDAGAVVRRQRRPQDQLAAVRQLAGKKASSASTSTAGDNLKEAVPEVNLVYVRDYSIAFAALKDGSVDAFSTDETVLRAIVQHDDRPDDYLFLPDFQKSRNVGFALKKGEPRFKDAVNKALLDIEASGEAAKIFTTWFGPGTEMPMARTFKIQPD